MKPVLLRLSRNRTSSSSGQLSEAIEIEADHTYTFGRVEICDICIPEKKVSRKHAGIYWSQDTNEIFLEDYQSLNGTYVNAKLITTPVAVQHRDQIQIGSEVFEINYPENELSEVQENDLTGQKPNPKPNNSKETKDIDLIEASDVNRLTGGRLISGKIKELGLADLIQMLGTTKKTGHLLLSKTKLFSVPQKMLGPDFASVYLQNGEIVYAESNGVQTEEAFYQILRWEDGFFALFPHYQFAFKKRIDMPVEALLLEGFRRLDEERAEAAEIAPGTEFNFNLDEPLTSLSQNHLKIFQLAMKYRKIEKIIEKSILSAPETEQVLKELVQLRFLTKA